MHNTQELAKTIKIVAKSKGILIRDMLHDCNVSVNTLSTMQSGGCYPRIDTITVIADYLNVSVDYLLGRSDDVGTSAAEDVNATELLNIYNKLSAVDKAKLLVYADNLAHNGGNDGNDSD